MYLIYHTTFYLIQCRLNKVLNFLWTKAFYNIYINTSYSITSQYSIFEYVIHIIQFIIIVHV